MSSTGSKVSADAILLSCLMKIFKVNVTIVITLFGSKLHERFSRSFTKRNGNQGMTVNILTIHQQFLCDKEATQRLLCHKYTIGRQKRRLLKSNCTSGTSYFHGPSYIKHLTWAHSSTPQPEMYLWRLCKKQKRKMVYSYVWKFQISKKKKIY